MKIGQEDTDRDRRIFDRGAASVGLTLRRFHAINIARANRWHDGFPADDDWNGADWSNALCGEAGESANIVKKLRRIETGKVGNQDADYATLSVALSKEIADVVTYASLLAAKYSIDLESALIDKFNEVSKRNGFPERL